ncbi:MAG TPA: hypothetical protein VGR27_10400, partial [Longimicrobiaceae bacterium]|nr:hypothetical protein [Longimicrobiaceae bacterium]
MHHIPIPSAIPFRTLDRPAGSVLGLVAVLIVIGVAAILLSLGHPGRIWDALLFNWFFWSSMALGMVVLAAALQITNAHWAWSIRRFAVGGAAFLPISFLILPVLYFGSEHYFHHWLHPDPADHVLQAKSAWLNLPFLITRDILAVAILYTLALAFFYYSVRPDVYGAGKGRHRSLYERITRGWRGVPEEADRSRYILDRLAPILAITYAVVWGLVAIDMAMSLEPHWFSTMFPVAFFWTGFQGGVAATAIAVTLLRNRLGLQDFITVRQYHDIGKMLFAFSVFWMYLNWSQYIVIWYGLLPHEQEWFVHRFSGYFPPFVQAVVVLVFVLPFFGLLTRPPKMVPGIVVFFASSILLGHWIERFLLVRPSLVEYGEGFP